MEALKSIIIALIAIVLSIGLGIAVMINGWGLEPKSYFWIIAVIFIGQLVAQIMISIARTGGNK